MLRFRGSYDRHPRTDRQGRWAGRPAWMIPTVDQVEALTAAMTADTVLQILRGQGIYWGWEVEPTGNDGRQPQRRVRSLDAERARWERQQQQKQASVAKRKARVARRTRLRAAVDDPDREQHWLTRRLQRRRLEKRWLAH